MSFRIFPTDKTNINTRKEKDSFLAHHISIHLDSSNERASASTCKASMTLEAAIVIPIFFFGVLSMVYLLEVMSIQVSVKSALYSVAREYAEEAYVPKIYSSEDVEKRLVEIIGEKMLERSWIVDGAGGLQCSDTTFRPRTAVTDFSVKYRLEMPVLFFRIPIFTKKEVVKCKGWNGYTGGFLTEQSEMVYVTEYGVVYHKDKKCTYLDLSVLAAAGEQVKDLRNQAGGKYYPCGYCGAKAGRAEYVYVTLYGNRYHTTLNCSRLKRNLYEVPIQDVYGLGGCKKCVK